MTSFEMLKRESVQSQVEEIAYNIVLANNTLHFAILDRDFEKAHAARDFNGECYEKLNDVWENNAALYGNDDDMFYSRVITPAIHRAKKALGSAVMQDENGNFYTNRNCKVYENIA